MTQTKTARAIIRITASGKADARINYSRRMYAIVRRYAPDVVEGGMSECYADLTGLRTYFKMSYAEIAEKIKKDLTKEIGVRFALSVATVDAFTKAENRVSERKKRQTSISTYKEIHSLLVGKTLTSAVRAKRTGTTRRKLTVPFIGAVS